MNLLIHYPSRFQPVRPLQQSLSSSATYTYPAAFDSFLPFESPYDDTPPIQCQQRASKRPLDHDHILAPGVKVLMGATAPQPQSKKQRFS